MQPLHQFPTRDLSSQHAFRASQCPARSLCRKHVCKARAVVHCCNEPRKQQASNTKTVLQASAQQHSSNVLQLTRRHLLESSSTLAAAVALVQPNPACAGIERYVKRKKLDPLETYVPLVLEARERLATLDTVMVTSPTEARQLMRSGPFSGLRDNIRALGQYAALPAAEGGSGLPEQNAQQLVSSFFRALEDFDLVLYNAVREAKAAQDKVDKESKKKNEEVEAGTEVVDAAIGLDREAAAAKLSAAVEQLDQLIATVPGGVLARSREVLEKVNRKATAAAEALAEAPAATSVQAADLQQVLQSL